ncbi:RNA polymerase sigma-70 factor, ECF subfamily [Streptomyces sp. 1331.2]|nr:RNA polymerase sigma-70 factor, ECF subfamily [Streptomyces sp. 1331.2]
MADCGGRCATGSGPGKGFAPRGHGGQSAEFNRVFTELLPRLQQAAASLTGNRLAAGDIVHDAYLRIARRPERFLGHPQPYAYAFTTMVNILRDQWRRERRRIPVPELPEAAAGLGRDRMVPDPRAGGMAELQARWEVVRLLGFLTVKQARAVALVDLDGYSVDEAAELLGLHRSTLAVTRRRAHGRLRAVLEHERQHEHEHGRQHERGRGRDRGWHPSSGAGRRPDAPN